jgi:hypothetical protein
MRLTPHPLSVDIHSTQDENSNAFGGQKFSVTRSSGYLIIIHQNNGV